MGVSLKQNADGSTSLISEAGSVDHARFGGGKGAAAPGFRGQITAKIALAAVGTAGGIFAWQAPANTDIIVTDLTVDVTTQTAGACTLDAGPAADATTLNDTLIDGVSLAAAGQFNNYDDKGSNGKFHRRVSAAGWITGSVASGTVTGLVGWAYITYIPVGA